LDLNAPNKKNEYPLELAIKFNQTNVVRSMLETKNLSLCIKKDTFQYYPLIDCCEKDLTEIAVMLIENGADINEYDNKEQKWTPLMYAITNKNQLIVEKLVSYKCNVNIVDGEGNTPLHLAAMSSDEHLVKSILKLQPDRKLKNSSDQTPYDIAMENEDDSLINLML
jgi:ankyrin repeat protein